MTLVLLDTNSYLRLVKRIRPLLGKPFGQKSYILTILKQVEDEVHRSARLQSRFPWFENDEFAKERLAKRVNLGKDEKETVRLVTKFLRQSVLANATDYTVHHRAPPSETDCYMLAFGQVREAIVVTDDLGMHKLADEFDIPVWHGFQLLKKMLSAKLVDKALVEEIYVALEANEDLPAKWRAAKHTEFKKVFGPPR
ncbi:MAG: hypothetical protein AB7U63_00810 [Porticoccaceae bacterium]